MVASYDTPAPLIVDGLNDIGLDCFEPKGAFYAFPSVRSTGMNEHEFCERLLVEEHVAVIPGSALGRGGEGHVRCAYAASIEPHREGAGAHGSLRAPPQLTAKQRGEPEYAEKNRDKQVVSLRSPRPLRWMVFPRLKYACRLTQVELPGGVGPARASSSRSSS